MSMQDFFNTYAPRLPPLNRDVRRSRLPRQTTGEVAARIRQREALLNQLGIGPQSPAALNAGPAGGYGIPMPSATAIDPQAARVSMASGLPQPSPTGAGFGGLPPMPPMAPVTEGSSILPSAPLAQQAVQSPGATPMSTTGGQGILPGIPSSQRPPSGIPTSAAAPSPVPGQQALPFGAGAAAGAGNAVPEAGAGAGGVGGAAGAAAGAAEGEAAAAGRLASLRARLGLGGSAASPLSSMSFGQRVLPALSYYSLGQAGNQLARQIPGSIHGVDVGDRSGNILGMGGTTAALATLLAPEYVLPAALGGAALGALGIGQGSSILGGGQGGGGNLSADDARTNLTNTFNSIGLSPSSAHALNNDFTILTAQGVSPQEAMQTVLQSAQQVAAQDAADERRRGAALGQQAVIGNFINPVIEGSTSLSRSPAGRSVLAALSQQAHSIPLVQEYQAELARQQQGMGSSSLSLADLANLAGQG